MVKAPPGAVAAGWGRGYAVDAQNRVTRRPEGWSD
jgi:hypothetical protein